MTQNKPLASATGPKLRVAVLGGCEEVGRNCTMIEYGNDIILIDMGLQFPDENMPGIDYIIPNVSCLRGKEKNVRGVIITHGHYDHIGAIPHVVPYIGNPPIFALPMAAGIIKKRQTDFNTTPLNVKVTKVSDVLQLGNLKVSFFHINHNIPDSAGIVVETPEGVVCHTGDWKFDFHPAGTPHADFQEIAAIGRRGVMCLMGDSTNSDQPGHQVSEKDIGENLAAIIEKAPGRVIVGTFASLLSRVKQILEASEKLGKKICIMGYSMKTNVEIAKELAFINVKKDSFIEETQIDDYPKNKVVIVCTGAQGEENAALMRIANDEHRSIRIVEGDTVIFSSSIVPGNEQSVQRVKDTLYRKKARVIHKALAGQMMDVHAGGHAKQEDIKLMLALFKPKYYVPIEGNHFLLRENGMVAESMGWKKENIFIVDNGQVMEFSKGDGVLTQEKLPTDYVFVDGLGVGDVSEVVLRDRQMLSEDGMVVVVATIDKKTGAAITAPDIISRGFVYMKENRELIEDTRALAKKILVGHKPGTAESEEVMKDKLRNDIGQFLFMRTERRPMIIPVLIEV
jgi:ribonuclease J